MNIVAAPARPGLWLDTDQPLTPRTIRAAKAAGYLGFFRYAPLPGNFSKWDISGAELAAIVKEDMQCGIVQHVRLPGWWPADHSGAADSMVATRHIILCGYPTGAVLYCDLEGIDGTLEETKRYANDYASATLAAQQQPGVYGGYQDPLDATQLYYLHAVRTYWVDAGPRTVATRGHAVKQRGEIVIDGTKFDLDVVAPDLLGELPLVATLAA